MIKYFMGKLGFILCVLEAEQLGVFVQTLLRLMVFLICCKPAEVSNCDTSEASSRYKNYNGTLKAPFSGGGRTVAPVPGLGFQAPPPS